ncbi:MAG: hypothetical protein LDL26_07010, partial [Caenispirillum bisanense]|nr:hypothetical protein [Caenispirillum bisanense]MCA1972458.1 hypothetical protein [Caenispirillum sp.]
MTTAGDGGPRMNARLTWLLVGLSVGVWTVFFMVTFLAYSLYHHYSLTREVTERLQVIAASVSTPAANAVYALDRESMKAIAEGALVHLEIGRVTIRDAELDDAVVVVERDGLRQEGRFALPPVTLPLNTHRPRGRGVLEVVNDPRYFQEIYVGRLWTFVAAGVGASFLLITVLTVAVNGVVVVPVVRLARAAAGMQAGAPGA